jgi:Phage integrase, N-terminal SAM-like domain
LRQLQSDLMPNTGRLLSSTAPTNDLRYNYWIRHYIVFHNKRHPQDMGSKEIEEFLTHLAVNENLAASTQNQAFHAVLFLYKEVIKL